MSTPTADELASAIHRICRDSVIDGTPGIHVVHKVGDLLTTYAAQVRRAQWQDISTAPKGRKLLLGYTNSLGKWRTVTGRFYPTGTLDWHDGLEQNEGQPEWPPEDWYEESETHEELLPLTGGQTPTHWQPLPDPPSPVKAASERDG